MITQIIIGIHKMKISFNLNSPKKEVSAIQISMSWKGKRYQKNIGYSVETKYWDKDKHEVKTNHNNAVAFNAYLHDLKTRVLEIYHDKLNYYKDTSVNVMKKEVIDLLSNGISKERKNLDLIDVFNEFINKYKPKGRKPAQKTIDSYINTRNKLIRYMKERRIKLEFDDFDNDFYEDFVDYLYGLNNNDNTIGTNITKLKTFMNWSLEKKYHTNEEFRKFKTLKAEALFKIALTEVEVQRLQHLNPNNKDLEFAQFFMLVNCHVGLRFSDLLDVVKNHTITGNELRIVQIKTRNPVKLYISEKVKDMILRLKELYIAKYDRENINLNLKEIGKTLGMNEIESATKLVGNDRFTIEKPRWQLLTTHVGRRTFATTAAMKGMPLHVIKQYTGHKSLDSLEKYLNAANFDDREILENLFNLEW